MSTYEALTLLFLFGTFLIALGVTDRTIARYISELKSYKVINRVGPDNGGRWKILL